MLGENFINNNIENVKKSYVEKVKELANNITNYFSYNPFTDPNYNEKWFVDTFKVNDNDKTYNLAYVLEGAINSIVKGDISTENGYVKKCLSDAMNNVSEQIITLDASVKKYEAMSSKKIDLSNYLTTVYNYYIASLSKSLYNGGFIELLSKLYSIWSTNITWDYTNASEYLEKIRNKNFYSTDYKSFQEIMKENNEKNMKAITKYLILIIGTEKLKNEILQNYLYMSDGMINIINKYENSKITATEQKIVVFWLNKIISVVNNNTYEKIYYKSELSKLFVNGTKIVVIDNLYNEWKNKIVSIGTEKENITLFSQYNTVNNQKIYEILTTIDALIKKNSVTSISESYKYLCMFIIVYGIVGINEYVQGYNNINVQISSIVQKNKKDASDKDDNINEYNQRIIDYINLLTLENKDTPKSKILEYEIQDDNIKINAVINAVIINNDNEKAVGGFINNVLPKTSWESPFIQMKNRQYVIMNKSNEIVYPSNYKFPKVNNVKDNTEVDLKKLLDDTIAEPKDDIKNYDAYKKSYIYSNLLNMYGYINPIDNNITSLYTRLANIICNLCISIYVAGKYNKNDENTKKYLKLLYCTPQQMEIYITHFKDIIVTLSEYGNKYKDHAIFALSFIYHFCENKGNGYSNKQLYYSPNHTDGCVETIINVEKIFSDTTYDINRKYGALVNSNYNNYKNFITGIIENYKRLSARYIGDNTDALNNITAISPLNNTSLLLFANSFINSIYFSYVFYGGNLTETFKSDLSLCKMNEFYTIEENSGKGITEYFISPKTGRRVYTYINDVKQPVNYKKEGVDREAFYAFCDKRENAIIVESEQPHEKETFISTGTSSANYNKDMDIITGPALFTNQIIEHDKNWKDVRENVTKTNIATDGENILGAGPGNKYDKQMKSHIRNMEILQSANNEYNTPEMLKEINKNLNTDLSSSPETAMYSRANQTKSKIIDLQDRAIGVLPEKYYPERTKNRNIYKANEIIPIAGFDIHEDRIGEDLAQTHSVEHLSRHKRRIPTVAGTGESLSKQFGTPVENTTEKFESNDENYNLGKTMIGCEGSKYWKPDKYM